MVEECIVEDCQFVDSNNANYVLLCWGCLPLQLAEKHMQVAEKPIPRCCKVAAGNSCEIKINKCIAMLPRLEEPISGMGLR